MVNPKLHKSKLKKGLYLIPTPIGNLGDITFRAVEILKRSDYILCEDTRLSKNLIKIINILKDSKIVSLISDAGTPGISDPGAILINACLSHGIDVIPLPGPSAITAAISVSGFDDKYLFYGFFPEKEKMIKE